jgi:tRNA (guanine-N7-)-methyltransferase
MADLDVGGTGAPVAGTDASDVSAPVSEVRGRAFFSRRHGKALRPRQQALLRDLLPKLLAMADRPEPREGNGPVGTAGNGGPGRAGPSAAGTLDPVALFGRQAPLWLEIGFGSGEHLLTLALRHPEVDFIGCEAYINGVAALLSSIGEVPPANLRIHPGDALDLIRRLPGQSLSRVFLLYPDPWPKRRHADRRFVSRPMLAELSRAMRPGSELRIATDVPDYVRHCLQAVAMSPQFKVANIKSEPAPAAGLPCTGDPVGGEAPGRGPDVTCSATAFAEAGNPVQDRSRPAGIGHREEARPPDVAAAFLSAWPGWHPTRYERKAIRQGRRPHYLRLLHAPG